MPLIDIHGHQVHIDQGSDSAKHAVHFLDEHPNDAHAFFDEAKRNITTGVSHFEINRPAGYMGSTKFTLIHHDDGKYTLRKKDHHMF